MPKLLDISVLYNTADVQVSVPSTYEEADTLLGETGGALDGFIADCSARNFLPRLYKAVAAKLEATGFPAKVVANKVTKTKDTEGKDSEKTVDVYETDIKHVGRIYTDGDEDQKKEIVELLQTTAKTIPFYAAGDRSGTGKVAQKYIDRANELIEGGMAAEAITMIESETPNYKVGVDGDGVPTAEGLARGIAAMDKHLQAQAARTTLSKLGLAK